MSQILGDYFHLYIHQLLVFPIFVPAATDKEGICCLFLLNIEVSSCLFSKYITISLMENSNCKE